MRDDSDDSDLGYQSEAEQIERLRRELDAIRVRFAVLEAELKRLNPQEVRDKLALLEARADVLRDAGDGVKRRLADLFLLVTLVLFVTAGQLGMALAGLFR